MLSLRRADLALNPQIGGGDYWGVSGSGNYNAMLADLKHQFSHQFTSRCSIQLGQEHGHQFRAVLGTDIPI